MNSSPPNHHIHSNRYTPTHINKIVFQLSHPVTVESIVLALGDLPRSVPLPPIIQNPSAPPNMGYDHNPDTGWSTHEDSTGFHSRDTFEYGIKDIDSKTLTNGRDQYHYHYRDAHSHFHTPVHTRHPTVTDSTTSWSTNNTRNNNDFDQYQHQHQQQYQSQRQQQTYPPHSRIAQSISSHRHPRSLHHIPPQRYPRSTQHSSPHRYPQPFQAMPPSETHDRFEPVLVHCESSVSPIPNGSTEDSIGQGFHDNYDTAHSSTSISGLGSHIRYNEDYKVNDRYINENNHRPNSEPSPPSSRQLENGQRNDPRTFAFDLFTGPIAHGPDACVIEERGGITFIEQHDEGLIFESTSLLEDGPDDPLATVHTRRYLDPVTANDPLIHLRLVMSADQLPRGDVFTRMCGHLRLQHLIDTFLIPHESSIVPNHFDVVFGLSGTLNRICGALRDLLKRLIHGMDGFVFWRLYFLIPLDMIHLVAEGRRERFNSDTPVYFSRCSLQRLRNATGKVYDPISDTDECILSVQSCSLEVILDAARCLGEILAQEEDSLLLCDEFYTGGFPSVIPAEKWLPKELLHSSTALDRLTPAGYLLRAEMRKCLQAIRVNRYHIQLFMLSEHASLLAGDYGEIVRRKCGRMGATLSFSEEALTDNEPVRFCDIGSNNCETLEAAVVEITRWLVEMELEGWSVKIIVPERIAETWRSADIVAGWAWRGFHHNVDLLSNIYKSMITDCFELEPAEEESVIAIKSMTMKNAIQAAARAILSAMYSLDA